MYVDPLAIYREYIQNAADAIDEAREPTCSDQKKTGKLRSTSTREANSEGPRQRHGDSAAEFENRMTSFGASVKRGTNARGFRGVGRLSGLAYCQELIFRSRKLVKRWFRSCAGIAERPNLFSAPQSSRGLAEVVAHRFRFAGWTERNGRGISSRLNSATSRVSGVIGC